MLFLLLLPLLPDDTAALEVKMMESESCMVDVDGFDAIMDNRSCDTSSDSVLSSSSNDVIC